MNDSTMLPFDYDTRRRKINLGGSNSASSSSTILNSVREQRLQRLSQKRQNEAALSIQSFWRSYLSSKELKNELRVTAFQSGSPPGGKGEDAGLTRLRCLMLLGKDTEALARWSGEFVKAGAGGEAGLFRLAKGPYASNWLICIRQIAWRILESVSLNPTSPTSSNHLSLLTNVLSSKSAGRQLGPELGSEAVQHILVYLLLHEYYKLIGGAISQIPLEQKKHPNLPPLLTLATIPLTSLPPSSPQYTYALSQLFTYILSIHLLPNRLPVDALPLFLSRIPLSHLHVLSSLPSTKGEDPILRGLSTEDHINLLANCTMFFTPHYSKFGNDSLGWYLRWTSTIFSSLPPGSFEPSSSPKSTATTASSSSKPTASNDSDDDTIKVTVVSSFTPPDPKPQIDTKTLTRLSKLSTLSHLDSLLVYARKSEKVQAGFVEWVLGLNYVSPSTREHVLTSILALTDGSLIRSLYRNSVRGSVLGRDGLGRDALFDPKNAQAWPPLLFLAELYAQALITMGDDEFFGTSSSSDSSYSTSALPSSRSGGAGSALVGETVQARNPLTLDEISNFARQMLGIAFTLYWVEDSNGSMSRGVAGYTLPTILTRLTTCLVAIHARDSRKRFMDVDGWLVNPSVVGGGAGMRGFVEAAILEETHLAEDPSVPLDLSTGGARRTNNNTNISKRALASLSPCLRVLHNIPFAIPFEVRVSIFRHFVLNDMVRVQGVGGRDRYSAFNHYNKTRIHVRRGRVAQDGFDRLSEADLKRPIEITFIDQFGSEEAGIDGGGVFKEFFTDLCKEVFDTDRGLWLANKKNELYPNPHSYATEAHSLNWYRFIGRVLGKAMYEGILVDVAFANFFLGRWLGKQSFLDDLASLDPDLYKGLLFLKHYKGNPEELALNFTVAVEELGTTQTIELIPNGTNIPVTKSNRLDYITLVSHYKLKKQIKKQSEAFFEGLSEMIDGRWLRMFNQQEVQILIGGVNSPIDLDDLRKHTNYGGLYDDQHPVIVAFWKVVNSFDQEQRRALLRFATSCSRPPLLGFKELAPNFSIRDAGQDANRLPTASTCVNLLKLPLYPNERIMKEKILQSITSNSGFDLS
ncbi:ubiquitin protein ligase [Coprinopsis sp. MPI-PUGE-AT-0042]|nr:ubiquitin protein ligase [Coprinopsis sp. MPI-PUGE-AT-0042]